jgi:DNA polymerase elongation subunit (family B)
MTEQANNGQRQPKAVALTKPKYMWGHWRKTITHLPERFDFWVTDIHIVGKGAGVPYWRTEDYLSPTSCQNQYGTKTHASVAQIIYNTAKSFQQQQKKYQTYQPKHQQKSDWEDVNEVDYTQDEQEDQPQSTVTIEPHDATRVSVSGVTNSGFSVTAHLEGFRPWIYVYFPEYENQIERDKGNKDKINRMKCDLKQLLKPDRNNPLNYVYSIEKEYKWRTYGFVPSKHNPYKRRKYLVWKIKVNSPVKKYETKLLELLKQIKCEKWEHECVKPENQFTAEYPEFPHCNWVRVLKWQESPLFYTTTQIEFVADVGDVVRSKEKRVREMPPMTVVSVDIEQAKGVTSKNVPKTADARPVVNNDSPDPMTIKGTDGKPIEHAGFPQPDEKNDVVICTSVNVYRYGALNPNHGLKSPMEDEPFDIASEYEIVDDYDKPGDQANNYHNRFRASKWTRNLFQARSDPQDVEAIQRRKEEEAATAEAKTTENDDNAPPRSTSSIDPKNINVEDLIESEVEADPIVEFEDAYALITKEYGLFGPKIESCNARLEEMNTTTSDNDPTPKTWQANGGDARSYFNMAMMSRYKMRCAFKQHVATFDLDKLFGSDENSPSALPAHLREMFQRFLNICKMFMTNAEKATAEMCTKIQDKFPGTTAKDIIPSDRACEQKLIKTPKTMTVFDGMRNVRNYCFLYDPLLFKETGCHSKKLAVRPLYSSRRCPDSALNNWVLCHVFDNELDAIMAYRDLLIYIHPDIVYGHNTHGYDWRVLFTRTNFLSNDRQPMIVTPGQPKIKFNTTCIPPVTSFEAWKHASSKQAPKTPYKYCNRFLFEKTDFVRKATTSKQSGAKERLYFDITGYADVDSYQSYKTMYKQEESYTLNHQSEDKLGDHKMDIGIGRMNACYRVRHFWPILAYCTYDSILSAGLMQSQGITAYQATVAHICHLSMDDVGKRGGSHLILTLFMWYIAKEGFVVEKDIPLTPEHLEGAKVFDAVSKMLPCIVPTLDFKSLYPSVIISNNLCPTTTMRVLDKNLDPVKMDWSKPEECEIKLREWDTIRTNLYGEKFIPEKFNTCEKDRQLFTFFYPMSSSVSIRVNQNEDENDYLGPWISVDVPDPTLEKPNKKKKIAQHHRDVAPVFDFIMDRPEFYDDVKEIKSSNPTASMDVDDDDDFDIQAYQKQPKKHRRAIENATGILCKMSQDLLDQREIPKAQMKKVKGDKLNYDPVNEVWIKPEAEMLYGQFDSQQNAIKVVCNTVYGWTSMKNQKETNNVNDENDPINQVENPVLNNQANYKYAIEDDEEENKGSKGNAFSAPGIGTTWFARRAIKFCAIETTCGWCPSKEDYNFLKEMFEKIKANMNKLMFNAKDFGEDLMARGMPDTPEAGNQTNDPGWRYPQNEKELDEMLAKCKSRWGLHVAYGDTDSIMVALWFVLCIAQLPDGKYWLDEKTRQKVINISKSLAIHLCKIFEKFHLPKMIIQWEKAIYPFIAVDKQKCYSGFLWMQAKIWQELILKSMEKRDMPQFLKEMLNRCAMYMSEDMCGVRVVPYVKRTLFKLARTGGRITSPGLLKMCTKNQALNKPDYTEESAGPHVCANMRLAKWNNGAEFGRGDRVSYVIVYTPPKKKLDKNGKLVEDKTIKHKAVSLKEISIELEKIRAQKNGEPLTADDVDKCKLPGFDTTLRLDISKLIEAVESNICYMFQTCLNSECKDDLRMLTTFSMSQKVTTSDGRVLDKREMTVEEICKRAYRIYIKAVNPPSEDFGTLMPTVAMEVTAPPPPLPTVTAPTPSSTKRSIFSLPNNKKRKTVTPPPQQASITAWMSKKRSRDELTPSTSQSSTTSSTKPTLMQQPPKPAIQSSQQQPQSRTLAMWMANTKKVPVCENSTSTMMAHHVNLTDLNDVEKVVHNVALAHDEDEYAIQQAQKEMNQEITTTPILQTPTITPINAFSLLQQPKKKITPPQPSTQSSVARNVLNSFIEQNAPPPEFALHEDEQNKTDMEPPSALKKTKLFEDGDGGVHTQQAPLGHVSIAGINKLVLLRILWHNQKMAGFFANMPMTAPAFDETKAILDIEKGPIDYFCGRAIKCDLSGDTANPEGYDSDAGQGTFARCVALVRANTMDES